MRMQSMQASTWTALAYMHACSGIAKGGPTQMFERPLYTLITQSNSLASMPAQIVIFHQHW